MAKNFLIITEGIRTEPNILEAVLKRYGFNVIRKDPIEINGEDQPFDLDVTKLSGDKDNIYIAKGPKNRIYEFLALIDSNSADIERYFSKFEENFSGIFLVYDVDHTLNEDLEKMFAKYNDETGSGCYLSRP